MHSQAEPGNESKFKLHRNAHMDPRSLEICKVSIITLWHPVNRNDWSGSRGRRYRL